MAGSSAITMYSNSNKTHESNIAGKEVWGGKKKENLFSSSFVGSSSGGVSFVNNKTRSTNDVQGKIIGTGIASDIALDGAGMLVVSDSATGAAKYTRRGDFRQDELGFWKNGSGMLLKAWKLDPNGELPQNSSLLSSLEAVNFANTKGLPVATSVISIAMNLNADQDALRGAGVDTVLNRTGLNTGKTKEDLLFPDKVGNKNLKIGDTFTFQSAGKDPLTVAYGGIVAAKSTNNDSPTYGVTSVNARFNFGVAANQAVDGGQLKITVGGTSYTFTANQGVESAQNKTFNSVNGLKNAINATNKLKAALDSNGRLYIAAVNPDNEIAFENQSNGTFVQGLQLSDVAARAGNEPVRFNSLMSLAQAVNANKDLYSVKATFDGGKDIKITSALATAGFNISANSTSKTLITQAVRRAGEEGRASIEISAPGHNLSAGDFIKIENGGGELTNGLYYVSATTNNGFIVHSKAAPAGFPAINAPVGLPPAGATWQKTAGFTYPDHNDATISAVVAGPGGAVTITIPGGQVALAAAPGGEGWANNDVVYISGLGGTKLSNGRDISIPDGYYVVGGFNLAAGGGNSTFTITPANNAAGAGAPAAPATIGVTKVASGAGGGLANMDTIAFNTDGGNGANSVVRYYMPNHGYSVGDTISFTTATVVDGIPVAANIPYKITATTVNSLDFQVFDGGGAVVPANNGNLGNAVLFSGLVAAFQVNNASQLMRYFGLDPNVLSFDASYNANEIDKNLSAAANGRANFGSKYTYSVPLSVIDSLGSDHKLTLYFAKLDANTWTVELTSTRDAEGNPDVKELPESGVIKSGTIIFDNDGKLTDTPNGFNEPISVEFSNGSARSSITIDWLNQLSEIKSGTVSQTKNPNNVEIIQNDGQVAGNLTRLEVAANGDVIGTFDSGEQRALYRVPVAMVANINGMVAGSNDTFDVSRDSGDVVIKGAGVGGAAKTLGAVLEASNVDTTTELLDVQDLSNTIRANARVAAVDNENFKTILSELQ